MHTININAIPDKSMVYVTGIVDYSRISSHIDGEELAADNAKKAQKGMRGTDKPHTRLTINQCAVDYENPSAPTLAEQYIAESLYKSTVHLENGMYYTATNKSRNLPAIFCRVNSQSKELRAVTTEGELAQGVPVTIALRFFATNQNSGVSLDSIIVNETPVKWFAATRGPEAALAARGFTVTNADNAPSVNEVRDQLAQPAPAAPTASAYVSPAPTAAAYTPSASEPSLPTPPNGYMYDENQRLVPIKNQGIAL